MDWRDNPKRALAVTLIDMAHTFDRSIKAGKNNTSHLIDQAAQCRAEARRLSAEADKVAA